MNKLRITLNEDGSVVQFAPDFKIIRGSYYDVLINIEVPHSLLVDPVTDTGDGSGATGNNVRVGGLISTANGRILQTKRYEFQYVKDFERAGTSYKLYQRKMPKEFTMWETVCENETGETGSLKLVINVVNWTLNDLEAKVEEVSASPAFYLDIYPSEYLTEEEEIESPSDFATLQSQVQDLSADYTTVKTDLYTDSGDGLGDYLTSRLLAGNKIVLTNTDNQVEVAVDTLYASDIVLNEVEDLDADNLQTAIEKLSSRSDSIHVDSVSGEDDSLVDNTDANNPVILHDSSKVDTATFDEAVDGLKSSILTNAEGISSINTNLDSYALISGTGAYIDIDIDTTNYVMTFVLKNASGETLSSQTIDFPIESVVVGATCKGSTLTLTLQNGTTLDVDVSSIIDGLVGQADFDELKAQVDANTENITANATKISTNAAEILENANEIATEINERKSADSTLQGNIESETTARTNADTDLQSQISSNDDDITALQSADTTLQGNIDVETTARTSADTTLQSNIDSLKLASGASLALSIDESTYVMTVQLKNSEGTILSSGTVDLPLETMVVSASYSDGKLYLTLKNGTQLDAIDISDIVSGLASQTDLDSEISARTSADSTLQSNIDSVDSSVVHIEGTETITGAKTFSNSVMVGIGTMIQADSNGAMEFGRRDGTTATPYIDFHTDGLSTTDYNVRILADGTQLRITAANGLMVNSNTLVDSSNKIPIDRLNYDTEITSDATDSNVPTSKAVYDLASSMGSSSSETIYVHVITMQHITYLTEVGMQIFSKSSEEMDFGDVASWLFLHGYTKHSKGLPLTGGAYTGTTGQPYVYATVYSANGTNISGRYYTGETTGNTGFGTGTNWQTYDTVYAIE